jgi:hypothetical protein
MRIHIHIYHHSHDGDSNSSINQKLDLIMATLQELSANELQVALDAEQAEIAAAIEALNATVADLQVLVAEGGSPQERQAVVDKINAVIADLQATIPDEPSTTSTTTEAPVEE